MLSSLLSLVALTVAAQPITLADALEASKRVGSARVATAQANAADAQATTAWRAAWVPSLGGEASFGVRDRDLTLVTPVGDLVVGERDQWLATARLTVPLIRPARWLAGAAADTKAQSARLQEGRLIRERQAEVVRTYFQWLALDADRRANAAFVTSLQARLRSVSAAVEFGRAVEVDRLRVDLALEDARQTGRVLQAGLHNLSENLGRLTGHGDALEPVRSSSITVAHLSEPGASALEVRRDLKAARLGQAALERQRRAVWAETLPELEARGEAVVDTAALYDETLFFRGSINLSWTPLAGLTRWSRSDQLKAEVQAAKAQVQELERVVRQQTQQAERALAVATQERLVAARGLKQAEAAVNQERQRFEEGRTTTADLLEVEAILRNRRARSERAIWTELERRAQLLLAAGEFGPDKLKQTTKEPRS